MIEIKVTCDSCGAWENESIRGSEQMHTTDANDWECWHLTPDGEKLCDQCYESRELKNEP